MPRLPKVPTAHKELQGGAGAWGILALAWMLGAAACLAAGQEAGRISRPERGRSSIVGGYWFQYLGANAGGMHEWLYPHLDGVPEIFRERAGSGAWDGSLDSVYNPAKGTFDRRFNGAETLNEFLAAPPRSTQRHEAARLLKLFLALHPAQKTPYYLRDDEKDILKELSPEDNEWVEARRRQYREAQARVQTPGTAVPGLEKPAAQNLGSQEYYRRMVQDGYLDIAVIGGNLYDTDRGTYHSWLYIEAFQTKLERAGFRRSAFRGAEDQTLCVKAVRLLGHPVVVRLHATGASLRPSRITRSVANFVEGMARADVFLYHGHSNMLSGSYFLAESAIPFARFQIGMRDQSDLVEKCHGLKEKPYQIFAFQSCNSYEKYCCPIRWYFEDRLPGRPGAAGFLGVAATCYFVDFIPRYTALIEALLAEAPGREIFERMSALRPNPLTPPILSRGMLTPRLSFIVPPGVTLRSMKELNATAAHLTVGEGSDGRTYHGSEVFPQNYAGEIVQVARVPGGLYGLRADGLLVDASPASGGGMVESTLAKGTGLRFSFLGRLTTRAGESRVLLAGQDGRLYSGSERIGLADRQPPAGLAFVAAGEDAQGRFVAQDSQGSFHAWDLKKHAYVPLEERPAFRTAEPSLLGHGEPGELWTPEGVVKR